MINSYNPISLWNWNANMGIHMVCRLSLQITFLSYVYFCQRIHYFRTDKMNRQYSYITPSSATYNLKQTTIKKNCFFSKISNKA